MQTGPNPTQKDACCTCWLGEIDIDRRSLVPSDYRRPGLDSKSGACVRGHGRYPKALKSLRHCPVAPALTKPSWALTESMAEFSGAFQV